MIIIRPDTAVKFQKKQLGAKDSNGVRPETWVDIYPYIVMVEWRNKFGSDIYKAAAIQAVEPAAIRLWYVPGITPDCRILRVNDEAAFEIINIDDIANRHQQLEIEVKRLVKG